MQITARVGCMTNEAVLPLLSVLAAGEVFSEGKEREKILDKIKKQSELGGINVIFVNKTFL
jgi:hypothetical protein